MVLGSFRIGNALIFNNKLNLSFKYLLAKSIHVNFVLFFLMKMVYHEQIKMLRNISVNI